MGKETEPQTKYQRILTNKSLLVYKIVSGGSTSLRTYNYFNSCRFGGTLIKQRKYRVPDYMFAVLVTLGYMFSIYILYPARMFCLLLIKRLAEKVLENCTAKLKPYLKQAVEESIDTSVHDYSKIVASICQEKLDNTKRNDGSASEEHLANQNRMLETGSDEPPQVAEELKPEMPRPEEVDPAKDKLEKPVSSNGAAQPGKDDSIIGLDSLEKKQCSDVDSS